MTHESKAKLGTSMVSIARSLLIALIAALGTHLIDVLAVKDRVDAMREEQVLNTKWRVESQGRFEQLQAFEENDLPTLLNGQRIMARQLQDIENELLEHERRERLRKAKK
jgi:hypothetical protein